MLSVSTARGVRGLMTRDLTHVRVAAGTWLMAFLMALVLAVACGEGDTTAPTTEPVSVTDAEPASGVYARIGTARTPGVSPQGAPQVGAPVYVEVAVWGEEPGGSVDLFAPNGIAIDSDDNVYVTEFEGHRVLKFAPDGELLAEWGSEGMRTASSRTRQASRSTAKGPFTSLRAVTIVCKSSRLPGNGWPRGALRGLRPESSCPPWS